MKNDSQRFNFFPIKEKDLPTPKPHLQPSSPPAPELAVCHPNFEGAGVTVVNGNVSWGVPTFSRGVDLVATGETETPLVIRFEQTGSPRPFYIGK